MTVNYIPTTWVNGTTPARNETNLNKQEQGILDAVTQANTNEANIATAATNIAVLEEKSNVIGEPSGFDHNLPLTMGVIELSPDGTKIVACDWNGNVTTRSDGLFYDGSSANAREFAISPVTVGDGGDGTFTIWIGGIKTVLSSTQKVTFLNQSGMQYVYFAAAGVLSSSDTLSYSYFEKEPIVSVVYGNAGDQELVIFGNERHGIKIRGFDHMYNHKFEGCRYESGMELQGVANGGTTYTQITSGVAYDEDLIMNPKQQTDAPFLWRDGLYWNVQADSTSIAYLDTGVAQFNCDTAYVNYGTSGVDYTATGSYELRDVTGNDRMIMFFILTNDCEFPYSKVLGQKVYANSAGARADVESAFSELKLDGLPSPEILALFAVIVDSVGQVDDISAEEVMVDLRRAKEGGTGTVSGVATIHNDTTDRDVVDAHPQGAITDLVSDLAAKADLTDLLIPDNRTTESVTFAKHSGLFDSTNIIDIINEVWDAGYTQVTATWDNGYISHGKIQVPYDSSFPLSCSGTFDFDMVGTYEWYTDKDVPSGFEFTVYNGAYNYIIATKALEDNGWYRWTAVVPDSNYKFVRLDPVNEYDVDHYSMYLIDRIAPVDVQLLSTEETKAIISTSGLSTSSGYFEHDNSQEIPTIEYVKNRLPIADGVTIESATEIPATSTAASLQDVFSDAWDSSFATSGYVLDPNSVGGITYNAGVITIADLNQNAYIMRHNPKTTGINGGIYKIITNQYIGDSAASGYFAYRTNGKYFYSYATTPVELQNGYWLYTLLISENAEYYELFVRSYVQTFNLEISFVKTAEYTDRQVLTTINTQAATGVTVDLSNPHGTMYNRASANSGTTYTATNLVIGGYAKCLINAATEPTVTGAIKIESPDFQPNTDMDLVIYTDDGTNVEYYFLER